MAVMAERIAPGAVVAGRRRGDALVQAIYDAALAEVAEHGYQAFSMERVAERAGAGKASLYRRWTSRFELIVEALDHRMPRFEVSPDTGSLRGDLMAVMTAIAAAMNSSVGGAARACLWSLDSEPEVARALRERLIPPRRAMMMALLTRAADRGQARREAVTARIAELGPKLLHGEIIEYGGPVDPATVEGIVDEVLLPLLKP